MAGTATMSQQLKRLVERRHPQHAENIGEWGFIAQSLKGGAQYVEGNLFNHPKEDPKVFEARKKRAADHHVNFTAQVRDTYVGYLFQKPPTIASGLPDWLTTFIAEGDQEGRPLVELAKDAAGDQLGYGIVWIGVDKPRAPVDPTVLSAAQEEDLGLKPYAYLVPPMKVLDGKIERGQVRWLLLQEDTRDDADPLTSSGEVVTRWRLWTESEYLLIEKEKDSYRVVDQGNNPLGRVPFVPLRYGSGTGFACPGLLADIAHLDRAIFNQSSLKDEILYAVTFPQLGVPYKGDLYEEGDEPGSFRLTPEGAAVLRVGLHNVVPYDAEAGSPGYFSPDNGPVEAIGGSIDKIVRLLLGLALLDGEQPGEDGAQQGASGISKAYTFEKLNRRLASLADRIEAAFRSVFDLVALWMGEDPTTLAEGVIWDFPDNFEVRSLAQDIEEFAAIIGSNPPSHTATSLLWKGILRKALPKATAEDWEAIEAEIDATSERSLTGVMGKGLQATGKGQQEDTETDEGVDDEPVDGGQD